MPVRGYWAASDVPENDLVHIVDADWSTLQILTVLPLMNADCCCLWMLTVAGCVLSLLLLMDADCCCLWMRTVALFAYCDCCCLWMLTVVVCGC